MSKCGCKNHAKGQMNEHANASNANNSACKSSAEKPANCGNHDAK